MSVKQAEEAVRELGQQATRRVYREACGPLAQHLIAASVMLTGSCLQFRPDPIQRKPERDYRCVCCREPIPPGKAGRMCQACRKLDS